MTRTDYSISKVCTFIILIFVVGCSSEQPTSSQGDESESGVDESKITLQTESEIVQQLIEIATPPTAEEAEQFAADEFWLVRMNKAEDIFGKLTRDQNEAALCEAISAFGEYGPYADFILVYGASGINMPLHRDFRIIPITKDKHGISGQEYANLQVSACRCFVERLLENPDLLSRYYRAALWNEYTRLVGSGGLRNWANETERGLKAGDPDEYWWYARNALVLMEATRKTSMLEDATPDDVGDRYLDWMNWFTERFDYLDPNPGDLHWDDSLLNKSNEFRWIKVPSQPFPDWEGQSPSRNVILWDGISTIRTNVNDTKKTDSSSPTEGVEGDGG